MVEGDASVAVGVPRAGVVTSACFRCLPDTYIARIAPSVIGCNRHDVQRTITCATTYGIIGFDTAMSLDISKRQASHEWRSNGPDILCADPGDSRKCLNYHSARWLFWHVRWQQE